MNDRGMPSEPRGAGQGGRWPFAPRRSGHLVLVACLLVCGSLALAQRPREQRRSRPPKVWDKAAAGTFYDDAFATLVGSRPVFGPSSPETRPTPAGPASPAPETGFKWSALVSGDTLVDEIKQARALTKAAVVKASDFKAGGYKKAQVAFSSAAAAFAVIAAYDKDVRWKADAAAARDLLARAGFNCKVGTDQSFNEAKDRVLDLETLIEGSPLTSKPVDDEEFSWERVAERSALMKRLEAAEGLAANATANRADFLRQVERIVQEAEMTALIGEVLQRPQFADHDDEEYRKASSAMREAAVRLRDAALKKDHDAGQKAFGDLKKSCDACHADFRG